VVGMQKIEDIGEEEVNEAEGTDTLLDDCSSETYSDSEHDESNL